jgi:hypothetical protein
MRAKLGRMVDDSDTEPATDADLIRAAEAAVRSLKATRGKGRPRKDRDAIIKEARAVRKQHGEKAALAFVREQLRSAEKGIGTLSDARILDLLKPGDK